MVEPVKRKISLLGVHPVHPGRGEPSYIELTIALDYLSGGPLASIRLSHKDTLSLIEQAVRAARVVED